MRGLFARTGRLRTLACALALAVATAGRAGPAAEIVDGLAAFVGDDAITISDVMGGVRVLLGDARWLAGRNPGEAFRAAFTEALGGLVNQRLIVQAYHRGEARLPDWVIERRMAELLDSRFGGERSRLMQELASQRLTILDWRQRVEEDLIVSAMRHSHIESNVRVSPAQVLAHYNAQRERFAEPGGTHLGLIYLRRRDNESEVQLAGRGRDVARRIEDGEPFEAVAREVSDDAAAQRGGDWGWINPEKTLRDELVAALATLDAGRTSPPVVTPTGVFLLRKKAERAGGVQPLEAVRTEIERELRREESERLFQAWIAHLRSQSDVRTFELSL